MKAPAGAIRHRINHKQRRPCPLNGTPSCEAGETCQNCQNDCGACPPNCGNNVCDPGETCSTCSLDCGACPPMCGNGMCEAGETCQGCPNDCGACQPVCVHDKCTTGTALSANCDPCVSQVCLADSFCCNNSWDSTCVGEVTSVCGLPCSGSCAHSECSSGAALMFGCSACSIDVCLNDPFCCASLWDSSCVSEVDVYCSFFCP